MNFCSKNEFKEDRAEFANLILTRDKIASENIPLQDLSWIKDMQNILGSTNNAEMATTSVIDDFELLELPKVRNTHTHTNKNMTFRELQGLDKALQRIRGDFKK